MNSSYLLLYEEAFDVIGVSLRTTNKAAVQDGTIAKLWHKFVTESVYTSIPNKIDTAIIALYYDFENGKNGEYTLLIGVKVSSLDELPMGMMGKHVLAQKRAVFTSQAGDRNHIVLDLWKTIWKLEDQHELPRNHIVDYELYDHRSQDPQNTVMEIHIGFE